MTESPQVALHVPNRHDQHQGPPLRLYLVAWVWLFVLSACSYLVDYAGVQGMLRWCLILTFMALKAALILAIFMHLAWERAALITAITLPPIAILVFVAIMALESNYTLFTRSVAFSGMP